MTSEEYKKLNDYLNLIFLELQKEDQFLLDNLSVITNLSIDYVNILKKYDLSDNSIQNNMTWQDVYLLARDIIETIDKNYLEQYDKLIDNG